MKTQYTLKVLLAGAAMAGLLGGTAIRVHAAQPGSSKTTLSAGQLADNTDSGKHSCKGQGGCKASDNGCKAKNSCKGKGGCATDGSKG